MPLGVDATTEERHAHLSSLLQEFTNIPNIDKAWLFKSDSSDTLGMFSITQPDLLANRTRTSILSCNILKESESSVKFQWAPFPIEMSGVSMIVPSPSGSKLLVIRNPENEAPSHFEIWSSCHMEKEFHIPQSVHGSVYNDGWFEGVSWNLDETLIAYVAEEPSPAKPIFNNLGYKKVACADKDCGSWKGQGDWEEDWGETYAGKRQPTLYVININSGEVHTVKGIDKSLSVGQVVWAPFTEGSEQYLVFVGWLSETRKLGMKYCSNRPCALYAVRAPHHESKSKDPEHCTTEELHALNLTPTISSALFPRFSPNGKFLVFLSARSAVDSGVHNATNSLHRIDWPTDGKLYQSSKIYDIIPVVMCAEDGCFPGLYCTTIHNKPFLSDNCTMIISSIWHSSEVLLSVNVLSGEILHISLPDSNFSWNLVMLDGNNIVATSSNPVDAPQIKYGMFNEKAKRTTWSWSNISSSMFKCSDKIRSLLSSLQCRILKIPVKDACDCPTKGATKPFEAIFVSSKTKSKDVFDPLIVILHGGPQDVSLSHFSKSWAFLSSVGYSLLIVNYRGSLGFGEEALQSLPGNVGSQDVNDVLSAIDHVINLGLASPSKITVMGISHGGFLTTHLIGQAPEKFVAAAAINPVCNFALMVGTTDIPDWCYVEACGIARNYNAEAPSTEDLNLFYSKSPISHVSKVKTPTLFLLGAQDLRVPNFDGLQYARALKEKGVAVKIIMFQNDVHALKRPQSDWECFLSIGVWFNNKRFSRISAAMEKEFPSGLDEATEQEFALQSNLLQQFTAISTIDKAWLFKSHTHTDSQGMFCVSQPNLLANKRKKFILSSTISKQNDGSVSFQWAPFPVEMSGVSVMVPSPSASKLLIVRNPESEEAPSRFEIWSSSHLEKEFHIPQSKHGSVYTDGWFEGISWNSDETHIAYVAEEPSPAKPTFGDQGYKKGGSDDKGCGTWKGQGDWEEDWGETYAGKRQPALFVINITRFCVVYIHSIIKGSAQYLVFVGWSFETRKLGIKYCYNRPCALYAVKAPHDSKANETEISSTEDVKVLNLTETISSAFFPRFSPDGKFLVFLSARSSVDSGAHSATNSLHRIDWPRDTELHQSAKVHDVVPVVLCAEDGSFPGLYCSSILSDPWLSDGYTLILPSIWHSSQVLLSVNVLSGKILCITPADSNFSWSLLTLDGNNILAVSSSPVDVPQVKYGTFVRKAADNEWSWSDVSSPMFKCSDKVRSLLSSLTFSVMKISVKDESESPTKEPIDHSRKKGRNPTK
ncbi:WD40/YVTN repeat-like-containing domain superfamily [Sesbania bispinosa]|nr:WD40/YVTN repeat-like-containing domain superfamily [Sesbania bispinosa]